MQRWDLQFHLLTVMGSQSMDESSPYEDESGTRGARAPLREDQFA